MLDAFLGHYAYWGAIVLLAIGLYTVTAGTNLVKKVMGLSIFQSAVFVLYISIGAVENATAPIVDPSHGAYANPLPHVLILTAIVVGVATAALALALVVRIHAECGSIEEDSIERVLLATGPVEAWIGGRGGEGPAVPDGAGTDPASLATAPVEAGTGGRGGEGPSEPDGTGAEPAAKPHPGGEGGAGANGGELPEDRSR